MVRAGFTTLLIVMFPRPFNFIFTDTENGLPYPADSLSLQKTGYPHILQPTSHGSTREEATAGGSPRQATRTFLLTPHKNRVKRMVF